MPSNEPIHQQDLKKTIGSNPLLLCLAYWIAFMVLLFGLSKLAALIVPEFAMQVQAVAGLFSAFFVTWLFLRFEKRTFRSIRLIGEKATLPRFLLGALIGALIIVLMVACLLGFTQLKLLRNPDARSGFMWIIYLASIIPLAIMEEVAFRSYTFLKLQERYGIWAAQLITALAFAAYHMAYGWSLYISMLGPFVWSFIFGLAAMRSGGIALPSGMHAAMNIMQMLVGLKTGQISMWFLRHEKGSLPGAQLQTDRVGLMLQFSVLAVGLLLTALYRPRKTV